MFIFAAMNKTLTWLGKNKLIALLLTIALYFCIVTFHDEVTQIVIKIRNHFGKEKYNLALGWGFLILLLLFITYVAFDIYRNIHKMLTLSLTAGITILLVAAFNTLMVYNVEAIHFVEYMMVAILLFPVLRSYGETVFWVTMIGILDEIFQYRFLTPEFEYFDFNDCLLNLLGASTGMVFIFITAGNAIGIRHTKWYRSPAVVTGLGLLALFILLLVSGKMTINPATTENAGNWFSLNRKTSAGEFWIHAYPGRHFHILRPFEALTIYYLLFAGFFGLDFTVSHLRGNDGKERE